MSINKRRGTKPTAVRKRRSTSGRAAREDRPASIATLRSWVHEHMHLPAGEEVALLDACKGVVAGQRERLNRATVKALRTQSEGMAKSFEGTLAELTDQAHRDPKTALLHFPCFMERLERFLASERRHRWCAVGLVDISNFKWYNDTVGHLAGDRIIARVARILAEQIRSSDLLTRECRLPGPQTTENLHARLGGDEFCFLIPDVLSFSEACTIAQRFKTVVERYPWATEDPALAKRPVCVDVGMVCVWPGPIADRPLRAGELAVELVRRADQLMYAAKEEHAATVRALGLRVENGGLIETFGWESAAPAEVAIEPQVPVCRAS